MENTLSHLDFDPVCEVRLSPVPKLSVRAFKKGIFKVMNRFGYKQVQSALQSMAARLGSWQGVLYRLDRESQLKFDVFNSH